MILFCMTNAKNDKKNGFEIYYCKDANKAFIDFGNKESKMELENI